MMARSTRLVARFRAHLKRQKRRPRGARGDLQVPEATGRESIVLGRWAEGCASARYRPRRWTAGLGSQVLATE